MMDAGSLAKIVELALTMVAAALAVVTAWFGMRAARHRRPGFRPQAEDPGSGTTDVTVVGASVLAPLGRLPAEVRGRELLLRGLHQRATHGGGMVVLVGVGGIGKSTLAAELVRRITAGRRGRRRPVWWVSGADATNLIAGMITVSRRLGATDLDVKALAGQAPDGPDRLWTLLERTRSGWLLVVDNADDPRLLAAPLIEPGTDGEGARRGRGVNLVTDGTGWVRPTRRGLVLVTSRHDDQATWGRGATVHRLGALTGAESARVLLDQAPRAGSVAQAEALGRRLGGLPLALHLAGRYLASEIKIWPSFDAYRRALDPDRAGVQLLDPDPDAEEVGDERAAVMVTWEISLDDLAERGVPQARALLRLLSCCAGAVPIPLDLLKPGLLANLLVLDGGRHVEHEQTAVRFEHALRGLARLGLVEITSSSGQKAVVVHPVIADTNRVYLLDPTSVPDPVSVQQTAIGLFVNEIGALHPQQWADWPRFRVLTPHLQALLALAADRCDAGHLILLAKTAIRAAEASHSSGAIAVAADLARGALACAGRLGRDHLVMLDARNRLAYETGHLGGWAEAEAGYREVYHARRRALGDDHPDTLATLRDLGRVLIERGRPAEAEAVLRNVLDTERRALGANHLDTLSTLHRLAWTLVERGQSAEAEAILREVLDRRRGVAADHTDTLNVRQILAWAIAEQGRWAEAEFALRELLEIRRRRLGTDHYSTLTTRHTLAWVIAEQGRHEEAEVTFREVREARGRTLGDDHPATLFTRNSLAWVVGELGRYSEAETAFREILDARARVLGDHHPDTLTTRRGLGRVVAAQGRWAEAEAALREVLDLRRRLLGADHTETLAVRHEFARVLLRSGRLAEAGTVLQEVLDARRRVLGDQHPYTIATRREVELHQSLTGEGSTTN